MGEGKNPRRHSRKRTERRIIPACDCFLLFIRQMPCQARTPRIIHTRARKHTHHSIVVVLDTELGVTKSYLSAQLRMVSVTFFCVSPSSGLVHRCVSWSTRFPGLSASTWTSGGGIITGRRAHTRTNTQAHAQKHRKQTK